MQNYDFLGKKTTDWGKMRRFNYIKKIGEKVKKRDFKTVIHGKFVTLRCFLGDMTFYLLNFPTTNYHLEQDRRANLYLKEIRYNGVGSPLRYRGCGRPVVGMAVCAVSCVWKSVRTCQRLQKCERKTIRELSK